MSKLVLHIPGGGMRDILLDRDRVTIGRRADNDVCLQYPAVSADHAEIVTVRGDSFLHDLGSTNGTLVNGKRIGKHFLHDHDAIDVGRVQLVYLADEAESVAPLEPEVAVPNASTADELARRDQASNAAVVHAVAEPAEPAFERHVAPEDELLAELMESSSETAVAVEMPPTISVAPGESRAIDTELRRTDAMSGVFVEVMNGPNAGQVAPMTRREFVLGKAGAAKAVIRREDDHFALVPVDPDVVSTVNGQHVPARGVRLAFGDTIDVAGVRLRFGRRPPL